MFVITDGIVLNNIIVKKNRVEYLYNFKGDMGKYFTTDRMFLEYDEGINMEGVPESILAIPFVASILPLMWLADGVMWVREIDRTFYESVSRIKAAYQNLYNHCTFKGNFVPAKFIENRYDIQRESILLFSGGIDGNATYIRIKDTEPILFNIQGWYKKTSDKLKDADSEVRLIREFAGKHNVPANFAKSNFAVLVDNNVFNRAFRKSFGDSWWHGFQHSMSFISIAIPLAYLGGVRNVYISSSVPMGDYFMCASHVTTDSEFKFATAGGCVHDGTEISRQDKIRLIVEYARKNHIDYPLKVCSFNDVNCCGCDKCFRSILGITAEGADIESFGFHVEGSLKNHFEKIMEKDIVKFNVKKEGYRHWPAIIGRMKENYDNIVDKEFVDWFLQYDFAGKRKKAVRKYYLTNFFSILKRKIFGK